MLWITKNNFQEHVWSSPDVDKWRKLDLQKKIVFIYKKKSKEMYRKYWCSCWFSLSFGNITPQESDGRSFQLQGWYSSYLALPRHADGGSILIAWCPVNDFLCLPHVEAIADRSAVELTFLTALHWKEGRKGKSRTRHKHKYFPKSS